MHRSYQRNELEMSNYFRTMKSPVGELFLIASDVALLAVLWGKEDPLLEKFAPMQERKSHPILCQTKVQLQEYFKGNRKEFSLPLQAIGTPFQKRVWSALQEIPYGETWSYGALAKRIGNPAASRAVGMANSKNPLSIIVPCHRVIGSSGKLVGFGGGLSNKEILLTTERQCLQL